MRDIARIGWAVIAAGTVAWSSSTAAAAYLYVALGVAFGLPPLRRLLSTAGLIAALYAILKAYHVVVFATTLYSTSQ